MVRLARLAMTRAPRSLALAAVALTLAVLAPGASAQQATDPRDLDALVACADAPDRPICILKVVARHQGGTLILIDRDLGLRPDLQREIGVSWEARDHWYATSPENAYDRRYFRDEAQQVRAGLEAIALFRGGATPETALASVERLPREVQWWAYHTMFFPAGYDRYEAPPQPPAELVPLLKVAAARWERRFAETSADDLSGASNAESVAMAYASIGEAEAAIRLFRGTSVDHIDQILFAGRLEEAARQATGPDGVCGKPGGRDLCQRKVIEAAVAAGRADIARQVADVALGENGPEKSNFSMGENGEIVRAASPDVARKWLIALEGVTVTYPYAPGNPVAAADNPYVVSNLLWGWRSVDPVRYRALMADLVAQVRTILAAGYPADEPPPPPVFQVHRSLMEDGDVETVRSLDPRLFIGDFLAVDLRHGRGVRSIDLYLADARATEASLFRDAAMNVTLLLRNCVDTAAALGDHESLAVCARRIADVADYFVWDDDLRNAAVHLLDSGQGDAADVLIRKLLPYERERVLAQPDGNHYRNNWLILAKAELRAQGRLTTRWSERPPAPLVRRADP